MSALLVIVVLAALGFEFVNGFHDTANAIATSVYTKALKVNQAIAIAVSMNFVGALVSTKVADVIKDLVTSEVELYVVLAALVGAIIWNLITWWKSMPSSSSHALIGSLVGATMVYSMSLDNVRWDTVIEKIILPLFASPFIGFIVAFFVFKFIVKLFANAQRVSANAFFRKAQIFSAALVAFSHGMNDAQKVMGIITFALIVVGILPDGASVPLWVKIVCATALACGTSVGGWRIMQTVGNKVTKLEPVGGFAAQTSSALVIEAMSFYGAPISTTQVITSAVMGVGAARRISAVKWQTAQSMVMTWVLTLPIAAAIGGLSLVVIRFFLG